MTAEQGLLLALSVIAGLLVLLALAIAAQRAWRAGRERQHRRRLEPLRPVLIELAAADAADRELFDRLAALGRRRWRVVEPTLVGLLGKIRGDARGPLVDLLELRGTLPRAVRQTRSWRSVRRAGAANVLGDLGDARAVDALVPLLRDRDPDVRQVSARALGRIGAARAAGHLVRVLTSTRTVPTSVVSQALLRMGPPTHLTMTVGTRNPDPIVRAVAAEILGRTGALSSVPRLVTLLRDDPVEEVRLRAATALGRLGLPTARPGLLEVTRRSAGSPRLRLVAASALGELGDPAAVPRLVRLLSDPTHHIAAAAGRALLQLGPAGLTALAEVAAGDERRSAVRHARDALAHGALRGLLPDAAVLEAAAEALDAPAPLDLARVA